jgi:hypothetical protein
MTHTETWYKAYQNTIGNKKGYSKRLKELLEWDKPFVKKENDTNGKWSEYDSKCEALKILLEN